MNKYEKLVVMVAILSSLVAFLDSSIVNVALPAIQKSLGGGLVVQQWVVDAYLLTLGSFILIAGSLSDLFGRKRLLVLGLAGFGITSLLCAFAASGTMLIITRGFQGLFGALLVPSSLAIISAFVSQENFSGAIGQWTSWTSIAFVIGPLLGGFLTDQFSWRLIFGINVLPIALTLYYIRKLPQEIRERKKSAADIPGAILCALGLGLIVFALIQQPRFGFLSNRVYVPLAGGALALALFFWREGRTAAPMLPLGLFRRRNFSVGNAATFFIYAALAAVTFLVTIFLQQTAHWSAFASGMAELPITIILFLFSPKVGKLSQTHGPRWFMGLGPLAAAAGVLCIGMLTAPGHVDYWKQMLPGMIILGIGLACIVAPLTATILGDVDKSNSGIASATNNAIARIAGLLAVAMLGLVAASFSLGMFAIAMTLAAGGLVSAFGIQNRPLPAPASPTY